MTSGIDRRGLFRTIMKGVTGGGLATGAVAAGLALREPKAPPLGARGDLGILRPPGSLDEADFLARCTRCNRCAQVCEPHCIRYFGPEAGHLQGTPYIVSQDKACTLCLKCGPACPTGAIATLKDMSEARMGVAEVDKRLCVSHNGSGICGACHTICPLKNRAITQNYRNQPLVHDDACVGCGLCEEVCIVHDRRAIRVVTERQHADSPKEGV